MDNFCDTYCPEITRLDRKEGRIVNGGISWMK
jgi:hypothetical protein